MHEAVFSRIQITTPRATTRGTFWVAVVKNCAIFYKLYIKWFQILETFYSSVTLIILATAKCTMNQWNDARDKCKYRRKWGKFGPSYLLNKNGDLFFYCIFRNRFWKEIVKESLKNCAITYLSKELSLVGSGSSEQTNQSPVLYKNYTKKTNVFYFFTTQRAKKSLTLTPQRP